MSYYEDERQRYRPTRDRPRRDSYEDDSVYTSRDTAKGSALVRRRDSYDSVEEIDRDFSPGRGGFTRETTVRRSGTRPARARSYEDSRYYDDRSSYDDRSYASTKRGGGYYDDRRDRRSHRYSSDYSDRSRSRTPPSRRDKDRRKSKTDEALEALGLGGLAATLLGKKDRSRSGSRDRKTRGRAHSEDRYSSRRDDKGRGPTKEQLTQAVKAAVLAGAGEAFRARKEPGGWTGDKGKRVLTAIVSAGGLDALISSNKGESEHKTRNALGSAIAGVATSRIVNGPRSKSRGREGSRSPNGRRRSPSRGGAGDLAAGGILAATAKKIYDAVNNRSESRGRQRSRSRDSYDSRSPSRKAGGRRRSLSRGLARSLSAVGLNRAASRVDPDSRAPSTTTGAQSRRYDDYDSRSGYSDYPRDDVGQPRSGPPDENSHARSASQSRSDWQVAHPHRSDTATSGYSLDYGPHHYGDPDTDSDSDLGSSSGEEKEVKKGKRKLLLTTGLASVATIHAGHSVYQSYEKRHSRQKAVREGKISREQAKENRNRDRLQDVASLGLAALGVKGAYSEWKELHEHRVELREEAEKAKRHRDKRMARREKYRSMGLDPDDGRMLSPGYPSNSMPDLHSPQPSSSHKHGEGPLGGRYSPDGGRYTASPAPYYNGPATNGPHYNDGNPYGMMPGPPMPPPGPMGHEYMSPPPFGVNTNTNMNMNANTNGNWDNAATHPRPERPRSVSVSPQPPYGDRRATSVGPLPDGHQR